jgi:hypothetical protein
VVENGTFFTTNGHELTRILNRNFTGANGGNGEDKTVTRINTNFLTTDEHGWTRMWAGKKQGTQKKKTFTRITRINTNSFTADERGFGIRGTKGRGFFNHEWTRINRNSE